MGWTLMGEIGALFDSILGWRICWWLFPGWRELFCWFRRGVLSLGNLWRFLWFGSCLWGFGLVERWGIGNWAAMLPSGFGDWPNLSKIYCPCYLRFGSYFWWWLLRCCSLKYQRSSFRFDWTILWWPWTLPQLTWLDFLYYFWSHLLYFLPRLIFII